MKKDTIKTMRAAIHLPVNAAAAPWSLREPGQTTEIIARTA